VSISTATTNADLSTRFICATTNGATPDCTCTPGFGVYNYSSPNIPSSTGTSPASPVFTEPTTLQAVACDSSPTNTWRASAIRAVSLTTVLPAPLLSPPTGTYENSLNVTVTNTSNYPSGTVFCFTADSTTTPVCTNTPTPFCAAGSEQYNGATGVTVNESGTAIAMVACSTTQRSPVALATYTLNVTPVVVTNATPTLTCGSNVTIGLDSSVSSHDLGGPTPDATICYSTNGAITGCGGGSGTTCFSAGSSGTNTQSLTINTSETIYTASCVNGFNTSVSSIPVTCQ
jgi:hypothetical protein